MHNGGISRGTSHAAFPERVDLFLYAMLAFARLALMEIAIVTSVIGESVLRLKVRTFEMGTEIRGLR